MSACWAALLPPPPPLLLDGSCRYHNALLGWSDITGALAAALPAGSITTSCPITAYRQQPDGTIQLLSSSSSSSGSSSSAHATADSSTQQDQGQDQEQPEQVVATCRALIGADGWFSSIRQQLLADGPPIFKDSVVFRARIQRLEGHPAQRTKWWVPPGGPTNTDMLAVLIPVPGGDLVWQCHAPLRVLQEKGLGFDAVKGEAVSSHADNTSSSSSGAKGSGSGSSSGGSRKDVKERCLKAFETFPPEFTDVVRATPAEVRPVQLV